MKHQLYGRCEWISRLLAWGPTVNWKGGQGGGRKAGVSYLTVKYISVAGPNCSKDLPDLCLPSHPPCSRSASASSLKRLNRAAFFFFFKHFSPCKGSSSPGIQATLLPSQIHLQGLYLHGRKLLVVAKWIIFGWVERVLQAGGCKTHLNTSGYHGTWHRLSTGVLGRIK